MDNSRVKRRPKGGASRFNAALATRSESLRRSNNVVSTLLCFTCGTCFALSLICLATLLALIDQTEAASHSRHGENIKKSTCYLWQSGIISMISGVIATQYDNNVSCLLIISPNSKFSKKKFVLQPIMTKSFAKYKSAFIRSAFNESFINVFGLCQYSQQRDKPSCVPLVL